ncbi:hypothetical protein D3C85_993980 [compost metagenome]
MVGVDLGHQALVYPALDALDVVPGLFVQLRGLLGRKVWRAVHDLAGEHLGGVGQLAGDADLRADVGGEHLEGVAGLVEGRGGLQQRLDDALQHLAVEVFLGLEVVVDVGLGQAGLGRDVARLGGGEPLVGEFLAGRAQDQVSVALANAAHIGSLVGSPGRQEGRPARGRAC